MKAVVAASSLEYRECDIELLSICWSCDHEGTGAEPFFLILPPDDLEVAAKTFGSLYAPELLTLAKDITSAFDLDPNQTFDECVLAQFGRPDRPEWFTKVAAKARDIIAQHARENASQQKRLEAAVAAEKAREARMISECSDVEGLVRRHGSAIPPMILAYLSKVEQPRAGTITNAIIVSWFLGEAKLPRLEFRDNLHWPPSLRLLKWIFSGQQTAVWTSLRNAGSIEAEAANRIEQLIELARTVPRGGGGTGAAISAGISRTWLSLLP
jgi:hypothetical protein